jgi:hypothetical protein
MDAFNRAGRSQNHGHGAGLHSREGGDPGGCLLPRYSYTWGKHLHVGHTGGVQIDGPPRFCHDPSMFRQAIALEASLNVDPTPKGIPISVMLKAKHWILAGLLLGFSCIGGTMARASLLNLSISEVTDRTVRLSWEFSEKDAVRFDYLVVKSGTIPSANAVPLGTMVFGPAQYSELWGEERRTLGS